MSIEILTGIMTFCPIHKSYATEEIDRINILEAVKKCMSNKDRINIILPLGTIERINSYGLKTSAFARELILSELDKMDRMKK